jgi:hypothetical protein
VDGNEDWFYGNCQISKANMFTIKQIDPPIELQCEINNDKDGRFQLITKGAFEETFEMSFTAEHIEKLLDF